ncbi:Arabinose-5-phosphate isomerase [Elusimicrobium minutum Pei191]|uniref:Arabinose-5-phosphate isomerase n=1 Tax=Elusimicrobium minutum (strain Pei191) TaxID=445932 RepID=B2KC19_ELUMP|nr:KpsF/GutQ family sugar-phosphate isomerase [Elusimicrobium minutum]ACC98146.1 Arabinose-5-phosphate isomerase [Elusimicrobium minutum Pei191]
MKNNSDEIKKTAKEVLEVENNELAKSHKSIDGNFIKSVNIINSISGRVVVLGIGKSGIIGRKIAATLASTGTPALFMHPVEALHGDLGMIQTSDAILALSFSGNTEEISKLIPLISKRKLPVISMTGNENSKLAKLSDVHIKMHVSKEACPYNLAPTSSTTVMLALGDALAICLMRLKHFEKKDFAVFHPGGSLGKLLTNNVSDLMSTGNMNPVVTGDKLVKDALFVMTKTKAGATSVVDKNGKLLGFFTDGDLRRALQADHNILDKKVSAIMTKKPTAVLQDTPAVEAAKIISERRIDNVPVIDKKGKVVGILDKSDLIDFIALIDKN